MKRTPKKNKKQPVNKGSNECSSPVDSNSPGDIINSKVNPEKKVTKYSEFLKMKQKKKANENKLEKGIEELSYKGNSLLDGNNGDQNNNDKDNEKTNDKFFIVSPYDESSMKIYESLKTEKCKVVPVIIANKKEHLEKTN